MLEQNFYWMWKNLAEITGNLRKWQQWIESIFVIVIVKFIELTSKFKFNLIFKNPKLYVLQFLALLDASARRKPIQLEDNFFR